MQRANIALMLAATLAAGCAQVQEVLGDIADGNGHGHGHGSGGGGSVTPPPASCGPTVTFDHVYRTVAADLAQLDAEDAPFQRYVTLANRFNDGECGAALDGPREAISELFNNLSIETLTARPLAIDADQLTYRVDLRDFAWDRQIVVDGQTFTDGWEAVIASSPFAIELTGPDADDAKVDTGTRVPLMSFDALANVAAKNSLYYALVDIPSTSDGLFRDDLAIDLDANRRDGEAVLAGTTRSRISRANRILERNEIGVRAGFIWRALDSFDESNIDIFADPLTQQSDGSVTLFTLPNGLLAFAIFDADGNRSDDSEILLDTNQNDFRARVSTSCLNCHSSGVLPVEDEVRAFFADNADDVDPDLAADVQLLYPPQAELDRLQAADSEQYQAARARAGVSSEGGDPLAAAVLAFDRDLDVQRMAADLGVTVDAIVSNRSILPVSFSQPIADRDDYAAVYADAACVLLSVSDNTAANCP